MSRIKGKCIVVGCKNMQKSRGMHKGHKCWKRLCDSHENTKEGQKAIRLKPKVGTPKKYLSKPK